MYTSSGIFARASRRVTVLFVDDDADTRFAFQSFATGEGFYVEVAADGYEAIALANIVLPDVIVLDVWLLPSLDGLEVARRLRASPRTRAIPIAIVSADLGDEMRDAVRASGCEGHLAKPCSADELLGLLNELAMRTPRDEVAAIRIGAR